jgi:hypothetical protein
MAAGQWGMRSFLSSGARKDIFSEMPEDYVQTEGIVDP